MCNCNLYSIDIFQLQGIIHSIFSSFLKIVVAESSKLTKQYISLYSSKPTVLQWVQIITSIGPNHNSFSIFIFNNIIIIFKQLCTCNMWTAVLISCKTISKKSIIILKQTRYLTWKYMHDVSIMYVNMNKCGSLLQ